MNGSKASIDEIIKFMNEKGVNPKTGCSPTLEHETFAQIALILILLNVVIFSYLVTV